MTRGVAHTGLAVKRLQVQHHRAANAGLAHLDLTLVQWDALRHLHENPGASLHNLAVLTFQTDQSFGALAGRLLQRGLVERLPGPGRAVRHRLTDKGNELRRTGAAVVAQVLAESFSPLNEAELAVFDGFLVRLLDARAAARGPDPS